MAPHNMEAQPPSQQGLGQDERHAEAADVPTPTQPSLQRQNQETADEYGRVVLQLNATWRIIECSDGLQWIVQRRKRGGAERPWRAVRYYQSRKALVRLCATSCGAVEPAVLDLLAGLPERIGAVGRPPEKVEPAAPGGPIKAQAALVQPQPRGAGRRSDRPNTLRSTKRRSGSSTFGGERPLVEEPRS